MVTREDEENFKLMPEKLEITIKPELVKKLDEVVEILHLNSKEDLIHCTIENMWTDVSWWTRSLVAPASKPEPGEKLEISLNPELVEMIDKAIINLGFESREELVNQTIQNMLKDPHIPRLGEK